MVPAAKRASVFFLSVFVCGQLLMLAHFTLVEHEICLEHGVATHRTHHDEKSGHPLKHSHDERDHCRFLTWLTSPKANISNSMPPAEQLEVPSTPVFADTVCYSASQRELFALAPSHSPPCPA